MIKSSPITEVKWLRRIFKLTMIREVPHSIVWRSGARESFMALESHVWCPRGTSKLLTEYFLLKSDLPDSDRKCRIVSSLSLWSHKPDNNGANVIQKVSLQWLILNAIIDSLYDRNNGCSPYAEISSLSELTIITLIRYMISDWDSFFRKKNRDRDQKTINYSTQAARWYFDIFDIDFYNFSNTVPQIQSQITPSQTWRDRINS